MSQSSIHSPRPRPTATVIASMLHRLVERANDGTTPTQIEREIAEQIAADLLRPDIDLANVVSVYSGKNGHCCCGCAGTHTVASTWREYAASQRGYPVRDNEVSDVTIKRIVSKMNRLGPQRNHGGDTPDNVWVVETETRRYIAYLNTAT